MPFAEVHPGDLIQSVNLNQIVDSLNGTSGAGQPVLLVALNDPNNYALTVQNLDPTNCRALMVLKNDGTPLLSAGCTGVTLGSPLNLAPGSITNNDLADGSISNAKLGPDVARANLLTNGGFEISQRGTAGVTMTAGGAYAADRWYGQVAGSGTGVIQSDSTPANVDVGSGVCLGANISATGGTTANGAAVIQKVEDYRQLRGKTVSFSIRCKTTAGTGTIQLGYSDGTSWTLATAASVTTTYATYTATFSVAANVTVVYIAVWFNAVAYYLLDNACLVVGSQPANYVPLHPADDLARCLRYYETVSVSGSYIAPGQCYGTTTAIGTLQWAVQKPVTPTLTVSAASTWGLTNAAFAVTPCTAFSASVAVPSSRIGQWSGSVASGLVAGNATTLSSAASQTGTITIEANP